MTEATTVLLFKQRKWTSDDRAGDGDAVTLLVALTSESDGMPLAGVVHIEAHNGLVFALRVYQDERLWDDDKELVAVLASIDASLDVDGLSRRAALEMKCFDASGHPTNRVISSLKIGRHLSSAVQWNLPREFAVDWGHSMIGTVLRFVNGVSSLKPCVCGRHFTAAGNDDDKCSARYK